jgi:hypothetical protein
MYTINTIQSCISRFHEAILQNLLEISLDRSAWQIRQERKMAETAETP